MSLDNDTSVSTTSHADSRRKISSISDHGHDNPAFDSPRSRKVSATSDHAGIGPVRKKSILHNAQASEANHHDEHLKHTNGDARIKKNSVTDSVHSKTRFSDIDENKRSCWYSFCVKCREKEEDLSWQPKIWSSMCPYPFCLTYRQFSRILAVTLIGIFTWGVAYAIIGDSVAPGGQLFQLMLLTICAHFGGWLVSLTTLPALIGMLFTGLIFQNVGLINFDESFSHVTRELRKTALVIILIRAGLDLDPQALKRLRLTVPKLGLIPWFVEAGVTAVMGHYLLNMPWIWCILLGTIVAAVSPAVVVPCLFRLRSKGYGVAKGMPTLIIAVAGIDDATSVAAFGVISSIMFSNDSLTAQILQGPICIIGGIGFGVIWGVISNYAPERHDPFVVPLRIIMLLAGGMVAVFGSEIIGYEGAGPLGCVSAAFVSLYFWTKQGWEVEDNPAATAFEIFWMIFEPILFGITGAQVNFSELDIHVVAIGIGCLFAGGIIRIMATVLVGIRSKLNLKEKVFVALSWMAKATVQAALGPLTLAVVGSKEPDKTYAEKILMICVLSIILTAPIGAILITILGPKLLTKMKAPQPPPEGWRRSHRPSICDISIINEDDEDGKENKVNDGNEGGQKYNISHDP